MKQNIVKITVIGQDKKGIIAKVTNYVFQQGANIEDIDQKVIQNLFQMIMHIDIEDLIISQEELIKGLKEIEKQIDMEIKVEFYSEKSRPNMLIMVTKEPHCLQAILKEWKEDQIKADIPLIIGSSIDLKYLAKEYEIPFYVFENNDKRKNEIAMLEFLKNFNIDLIVLARYMKILSPDFVWRYENQIINIHPSLLPSFPGSQAYRQAFEKGVRVAGATAHYVTMDLDKGPIITQDAFQIEPHMSIEQIKELGIEAEINALLKAVKLFLDDKLVVYWNKIHFRD